jgi:hypothetical protein
MIQLNDAAILVSGVTVFAFAAIYYSLLARQRAALSATAAARGRPPAWLLGLELGKALVVAAVVAGLVSLLGITEIGGAVALAIALWIAFPAVLLIGSVTQENVPLRLAAIHAGDWLAKLLIIAIVTSVWH